MLDPTGDLTQFGHDLDATAAAILDNVRPIIKRGALNVKNQLVGEMAASPSFRGIARSISFDTRDERPFSTYADVGPDKARRGGALANIAYFGGSRGGGATVPDPMLAAEAEAPELVRYIADVATVIVS